MKRDTLMDEQAREELRAMVEHDREDAGFEIVAALVIAMFMGICFAFCPEEAHAADSRALERRVATTSQRVMMLALFDAPAPVPVAKPKPSPKPSPVPAALEVEPEPIDIPTIATEEPGPEAVAESPVLPPPAPKPSPSPASSLARENARPFHVDTQLGALVTLTGEAGTDVTPTFWVNADGPLAVGNKLSLGRLGARLGLSSAPGETFDATDIKTYRAMEAAVWLGRVVGKLGEVSTTLVAEGTFSTRLKGANDPAPLNRTVRSGALGIRFDARKSNASLTALAGYDEATTSCAPLVVCTGVHAGLAILLYGQVPIAQGAVLFVGDASLAVGGSVAYLTRRDVVRVGIVVDPVQTVKVIRGK